MELFWRTGAECTGRPRSRGRRASDARSADIAGSSSPRTAGNLLKRRPKTTLPNGATRSDGSLARRTDSRQASKPARRAPASTSSAPTPASRPVAQIVVRDRNVFIDAAGSETRLTEDGATDDGYVDDVRRSRTDDASS